MADRINSGLREALLQKLFELMEMSDNIRVLPADRRERIKGKYREASLESIQRGISMLEADIEKKRAEQEKARESLNKNIEKRKQLKEQEKDEIRESERLAGQLLAQIGPIGKPKRKNRLLLILVLVVLIAAFLYYFRVIR